MEYWVDFLATSKRDFILMLELIIQKDFRTPLLFISEVGVVSILMQCQV